MKTSYLKLFTLLLTFLFFVSCGKEVFKSGDRARKISPDPRERVKKNLEEGKGFRVNDVLKNTKVLVILNFQVRMNCGEHLWT